MRLFFHKNGRAILNVAIFVLSMVLFVLLIKFGGSYAARLHAVPTEPTAETYPAETTVQTTAPTQAPTTQPTAATIPPSAETEPTWPVFAGEELVLEPIEYAQPCLLVPQKTMGFYNRDLSVDPEDDFKANYADPDIRLDVGLPVRLGVTVKDMPQYQKVVSTLVEVAENPDMKDARRFPLDGARTAVDVYHLKTGTKYYCRVTVYLIDGSQKVFDSSFETVAGIRFLDIEGTRNVRDFGGGTTADGKRIRQGLLYRGGELDGGAASNYILTEQGQYDMLLALGIVTDMDLRPETDNPSGIDALGPYVHHTYYNATAYRNILRNSRDVLVAKIFRCLSDSQSYPIYLHCTYGLDRTGTICYLLGAFLGMSEEDLQREYEVSVLSTGWLAMDGFQGLAEDLNAFSGDTLQEKAENYLLGTGLEPEALERIRENFLED